MVAPTDSTDEHGCGMRNAEESPTDSTDAHGCGIYKSAGICGRTISSCRLFLPQISRMHTDVGAQEEDTDFSDYTDVACGELQKKLT